MPNLAYDNYLLDGWCPEHHQRSNLISLAAYATSLLTVTRCVDCEAVARKVITPSDITILCVTLTCVYTLSPPSHAPNIHARALALVQMTLEVLDAKNASSCGS